MFQRIMRNANTAAKTRRVMAGRAEAKLDIADSSTRYWL